MNTRVQVPQTPTAAAPHFTPAPFGTLQRKCACGGSGGSGGECAGCKKEKMVLHRRAAPGAGQGAVPHIVHDVLRSPGQPLDAASRAFFEPRFGHDFSRVRVHADARAAESARAVNALAYTVGRDIVFANRSSIPGTVEGAHVLAHELAHVVQQRTTAGISHEVRSISSPQDAAEREAGAAAARIEMGDYPVSTMGTAPSSTLHRIGGITLPTGIRALDPGEVAILRPVFGASLDYSAIHLTDAVGGGGRPYTVAASIGGQVINIGPAAYKTPASNPRLLIHESTHCWQSQHHYSATAYMSNSIQSQAAAAATGGSSYCYIPGKPFGAYGAEQIAEQVENGEAPIIAHVSSVSPGAVDPENVAGLSVPHWETSGAPGVKC